MEAIREFVARYRWTPGPGVSNNEIVAAERALGPFPGGYREFLSEFGWLEFGSCEVYGLGSGKPDYMDVVRMTLSERAQPAVPLPESWVCVMNDGAGNLFSFDTNLVASGAENSPIFGTTSWEMIRISKSWHHHFRSG
ncbi:SMI1/KNR4 family protein [Actinophytocola gossypii]